MREKNKKIFLNYCGKAKYFLREIIENKIKIVTKIYKINLESN